MRYFLICEDADTLTGMRLAGIDGALATTKKDVERLIEQAASDEGIAVMLITTACAAMSPETVGKMKLSAHRPLVVVIPGSSETGSGGDSITELIRTAIGVKI